MLTVIVLTVMALPVAFYGTWAVLFYRAERLAIDAELREMCEAGL